MVRGLIHKDVVSWSFCSALAGGRHDRRYVALVGNIILEFVPILTEDDLARVKSCMVPNLLSELERKVLKYREGVEGN